MPENKQVKSRQRVSEHGEVFTAEREVKAMCDLVKQETERVDSRFLEPACGDGNFLAEIVSRKLAVCRKRYKTPYDFERYSILAMSSIYGVDILQDNVLECRKRMYEIWDKDYKAVCKKEVNDATRAAVRYILEKNILCGNALTLMCVDEVQQDIPGEPIIFAEWSMLAGTKLKRRDFRLDVLLKVNEKPPQDSQMSILDVNIPTELGPYISFNPVTKEYMAEPIREYPPVHYRRIVDNG